MNTNTFAWIGYFPDRANFYSTGTQRGLIDPKISLMDIDDLILKVDPIVGEIKRFSFEDKSANGFLMAIPILLKHFSTLHKTEIEDKITQTILIAVNNGANIILMAGALGDYVHEMKKRFSEYDIIILTGRKNLAATVLQNVEHAGSHFKRPVDQLECTILDLSAPISPIIASALGDRFKTVKLTNFNKIDLKKAVEPLKLPLSFEQLRVADDPEKSVSQSDLVISNILFIPPEILDHLKPGAILLDAVPPFMSAMSVKKKRPDVKPVKSALSELGPIEEGLFPQATHDNFFYCCLTEAVMVALQNRFDKAKVELVYENVMYFSEQKKRFGFNTPVF